MTTKGVLQTANNTVKKVLGVDREMVPRCDNVRSQNILQQERDAEERRYQ